MSNYVTKVILYIARTCMRIIYFFIKLFTKQKEKVTLLSRQSNTISLDFKLLLKELEKQNINTKVLCRKIPKKITGEIKYCFYTIKCMYHIATSKVCIIDGYNIPISALHHKKGLEVIQIWHALGAIKKFGYQVLDKKEGSSSKMAEIMKMHNNYTCVTCASEATRKIYAEAFNTNIDKIKVWGMPRIDYLLGKDNEINNNVHKLLLEYPKLKSKKNILYVPTFRKGKKINISDLIQSVNEEKYNLIIRLHPLDKTKLEEKYQIKNSYSTFDLIKVADYVITDYSAIAFETVSLNKPLFFYLYDLDEYNDIRGLNVNLQEKMGSSTRKDIKEIIEIIEKNEYSYEELKKFKEEYVETTDTNNTKRIVEYIKNKL